MKSTLTGIFVTSVLFAFGLLAVIAFSSPATAPVQIRTTFWILAGLTLWGVAALAFAVLSAVFDRSSDTALHGFSVVHGRNLMTSLRRGMEVVFVAAAALMLYRTGKSAREPLLYLAGFFIVLEGCILALRHFKKTV